MSGNQDGVLILKATASSMKAAEIFLKNREWRFASTHNLKEAITFIIKHQPKYLFIAADHPNKKARRMPKLIAQAFPITVIAYTESTSNQAAASIQSMGLEYNLFPPVSGPAIVRLVAKIEKDLERKAKEDKLRLEMLQQQAENPTSKESNSGIVTNDGDTTIIRDDYKAPDAVDESATSNALAQAKAALQQMLQSDAEEPVSTFEAPETESGTFQNQDPAQQKKGMAYMPTASEQSSDKKSGMLIAKGGGQKPGSGFQYNPTTQNDPFGSSDNWGSDGPQGVGGGSGFDPRTREKNPLRPTNPAPGEPGHDPFASDWATEKPNVNEKAMKSPSVKKNNSEVDNNVVGNDQEEQYKKVEILNSAFDSIVLKGAVDSFEGVLNHKVTGGGIQKIDDLNQVVCLVVDSARFSGYLIAAMGKKRVADDTLMGNIKAHLHDYMRKNGVDISEKDTGPLQLKVQQVGFQDWARDQAEFLIRSIHDDNEVAMAFFPTKDVKVNLEESFAEHMMKMTIDEISADMELEFDVFVYLPENQKYVKYNKEGQKMFGEQVNRLKDKGVTHVHMKKDSRDQVRKYKAQNYLNDKILAYKGKKSA